MRRVLAVLCLFYFASGGVCGDIPADSEVATPKVWPEVWMVCPEKTYLYCEDCQITHSWQEGKVFFFYIRKKGEDSYPDASPAECQPKEYKKGRYP